MQREPLLSMQEELREIVMRTQNRLTAVRKLMTHTRPASRQSSIGSGDTLPLHVSPHCGALIGDTAEHQEFEENLEAASDLCAVVSEVATASPQDASEPSPTSTATDRLEAIKRRLSEQIQKN
jgi:hypothetical protein